MEPGRLRRRIPFSTGTCLPANSPDLRQRPFIPSRFHSRSHCCAGLSSRRRRRRDLCPRHSETSASLSFSIQLTILSVARKHDDFSQSHRGFHPHQSSLAFAGFLCMANRHFISLALGLPAHRAFVFRRKVRRVVWCCLDRKPVCPAGGRDCSPHYGSVSHHALILHSLCPARHRFHCRVQLSVRGFLDLFHRSSPPAHGRLRRCLSGCLHRFKIRSFPYPSS